MVFLFRNKIRVFIFLVLAGIHSVMNCAGQNRNNPLSKPSNIELLNYHETRAQDFVSKNLNRFAFERLQKYNFLLDSMYSSEKKDTLASIEKGYLLGSASKKSTIDNLNKAITEYSAQKDKLEKRYWSLVRKAILSFALWLTIVLILLQFRKSRLKRINTKLQTTKIQLQTLETSVVNADKLTADFTKIKELLHKLIGEFISLNNISAEAVTKQNVPDGWAEISSKTTLLKKAIEGEEKILDAVLNQTGNQNDEKILTDINDLCERYVEIATRGFQNMNDFNCQVVRDFEKRLSPVKINPADVGSLLLNVLTNAFQSVKEQHSKGIKGYQPKISISTRILPRFLQIRIRDNGTGMKEDVLKMATDEFFTTHPFAEGSGLGLSVANNIIGMYKGELKIESEVGASTDIYIKFFI